MEKVESKSNMKELFEEFKFHLIYKNKQCKASPIVNDDYKELLAAIKEENRVKRAKIRHLNTQKEQDSKK